MIEFNKILKIYLRFLKEEGVYHRALSIHSGNGKINAKKALQDDILFTHWIQHEETFCLWSSTKEGKDFWWIIHLQWLIKCLDFCNGERIGHSIFILDKSYVKNSIEKFLSLFNPHSVDNEQMKNILMEKSKILKKYINYEQSINFN